MGSVPAIFWYLLCVVMFAVFPLVMVAAIHRHRMKALEILRSYAEKGGDPPPAIAELLMQQISEPKRKGPRPHAGHGCRPSWVTYSSPAFSAASPGGGWTRGTALIGLIFGVLGTIGELGTSLWLLFGGTGRRAFTDPSASAPDSRGDEDGVSALGKTVPAH